IFLGWLSSVLLNAIGLLVVAQLFEGFKIEGTGTILLAAVILTILNFAVRPVLIILTIPITILTHGLFILIVNAFILMMTHSLMGDSFIIDQFGTAILASILISIITIMLEGTGTILLAVVILTILNFAVRPVLIILSIPITILTLGLFILIVNAFILMMTLSLMGDSFIIEQFGTAILASILSSIITVILE